VVIEHVSDTALWIAAVRAKETARPDPIFRDHLAAKLAGDRGRAILASLPHSEAMNFALAIRTVAIDRLVEETVPLVDTVINLAAGMDTRPYRLKLPPQLRWIEIDYDHVLDRKTAQLADDKPNCKLERIAADLGEDDGRRKLFAELGARTKSALIISEGFIAYLKNEHAEAISKDLLAVPSFRYWTQDYGQGKRARHRRGRDIAKHMQNAPWQFTIDKPIEWFGSHGWKIHQQLYILDEADRVGRAFPSMFPWNVLLPLFPKTLRVSANKTYGYVTFTKVNSVSTANETSGQASS
jgi:methyltransferase (TIGR00027 family)